MTFKYKAIKQRRELTYTIDSMEEDDDADDECLDEENPQSDVFR